MKKFLLMASMMFAFSAATNAMPAKKGVWHTITLANGTEVTAELRGDEFLNWMETSDGQRLVANDNGRYVVADMPALQEAANARRALIGEARAQRLARATALKTDNGLLKTVIGGKHEPYLGKKKGLIILVEFTDKKFMDGHDLDFYKRVANERGFTHSEGFVGSVSDYFLAQSNGQFELDFDVVGPIQLAHKVSYYGSNTNGTTDANAAYMIKEACDGANKAGINFSDYDWDGDGEADQVFVLYAGYGEASGGAANTIWPHEWQMKYQTKVGILTYSTGKVNTYACANECTKDPQTKKDISEGIGGICHEFSHCLGFADMYDTYNQDNNYGMSYWDVMDSGSYNGDGFRPCNYTGYERMYAGWVEPIVLDKAATVLKMESSTDFARPFIVYNDKHKDEYYLLENRQKTGWDKSILGSGMLIMHVDFKQSIWQSNMVNSSKSDHMRCTIFHADNDAGFLKVVNGYTYIDRDNIKNDVYPYEDNDELTNTSKPAAKLYNVGLDGTKNMSKPITGITRNEDGTMAFKFMGGNDKNVISNATTNGISNITVSNKLAEDTRVYSIDGRCLGNDINALGHGMYIVGGKKIVK